MRNSQATAKQSAPSIISGAGWMLASHVVRLLLQAGYFVLLAEHFGSSDYGTFVGLASMVSFLAPIAGLGTGHILVRNTSRSASLAADALSDALSVTLATGLLLGPICFAIFHLFGATAVPTGLLMLLVASDVVGVQLIEISAQCFQASNKVFVSAILQIAPLVGRIVALSAAINYSEADRLTNWLLAYSTAGILVAATSIGIAIAHVRPSAPDPKRALRAARQGWMFSLMASSQAANADADKALLSRLATGSATGIYSAAYRLTDVAFAPVRALMYSSYARFYVAGAGGTADSIALAKRILRVSGSYSLLAGGVMWAAAPVVPWFIGESFADSVLALRWLAILLPLRAAHAAAADALVGAGHFIQRMTVTLTAAFANVALNLILIPLLGWRGAAIASIASDALLVVGLWGTLIVLSTREAAPDLHHHKQTL